MFSPIHDLLIYHIYLLLMHFRTISTRERVETEILDSLWKERSPHDKLQDMEHFCHIIWLGMTKTVSLYKKYCIAWYLSHIWNLYLSVSELMHRCSIGGFPVKTRNKHIVYRLVLMKWRYMYIYLHPSGICRGIHGLKSNHANRSF